MVMQTKLIFYVSYFVNKKQETFKKYLYIDDSTDINLGDEVVVFNEYNKISINFESDDENAVLEIDSSISDYPLQLKPSDEIITLCEGGEYSDYMLTPGYYGIGITVASKTYKGLYHINPQSISNNGLINLRRYLETIMSGLSQNLYIQRMNGQKNIYGDEESSIYKMYFHINNSILNVINSIENIIKNPLTDINKEYREQYCTKRQDIKSQRWLCTKGLNKNKNIYMPDIVFEKYSRLTNNIYENRYIKKIIKKILDRIIFVENEYSKIYLNSINTVKDKTDIYEQKEVDFNILNSDKVVSKEHKYDKREELKYLKNDIDKLKEHTLFINGILSNLKKFKAIFLHYINETWLNDIVCYDKEQKVSQKIFKDNRYYQIYNFYYNLLDIDKKDTTRKKPYFPSKKTSKLFEYYSVILVINILRESEFNWESGWLADSVNEELFSGEIVTNTPMIFKKDNLRFEITYEKEVELNLTVINNNISDFIRMNSRHYKPDILIALFDENTGDLLKSMIIEVKCRMSKYLQSKNGPSGAIEQARNYYNLGYYDKNKEGRDKARRSIIDEVIIIYPKQSKSIRYEYCDMILPFIQVEANDNSDVTTHYGYEELKNELSDCFQIF